MNKLKNNSKPLIWFMGLLLTAFVAGCGSGGDGGGGATAQPGTLGVSLTDAPACGFDAVNVTVSKVRVHQSSSADDKAAGWNDIVLDPPKRINLLDFNDPTQNNGALLSLGDISLPSGHYTQVRLVLSPNNGSTPPNNSVVLSDTKAEKPLDTPSAVQSGIKLVHEFDVPSGQRVDLLLDFDACHSIVHTGSDKYKLKPVIKVIPFVLNGIEGFVDTNLLGSNVAVSAQRDGEIVRATMPNANPLPNPNRGKFFLTHLAPGVTYDVVITADDHATTVIAGVLVPSSNSIIAVSTDAARTPVNAITLVPPSRSISGTVTFNPAPPPPTDDQVVFVVARQQLVAGPVVTVKSQVADVLAITPETDDYSYNLMLPIDSPWLASGSTTLPLPIAAFTQQPIPPSPQSIAGKYTVQASAAGYAPQSSNVDISVANQIQNFTLTP
ncbi:MAG TPA: DUF4382 domain-containing protein [Nitrospiraceae bacterium]|nr:DUF4382 domain-containing protein [Nitrospiraceae bacterium]